MRFEPSSLIKHLLMAGVRGYRLLLSPWLGNSCRFDPSCSAYALLALERHGAAAGTYLAVHRVLRCHPWCTPGLDPVPDCPPPLFRRFSRSAIHAPRSPSSSSNPEPTP